MDIYYLLNAYRPLSLSRTCAVLTRSFLNLGDSWQSLLQSLPAGGLQLTHVSVRLPVNPAHFLAVFALADTFGEPFARRMLALQSVAARQVVPAAARLTLSLRADQAAVTAVRHVSAGAAGAWTGAHIAPRGTLGFRLWRCASQVVKVEQDKRAQEKFHVQWRIFNGG